MDSTNAAVAAVQQAAAESIRQRAEDDKTAECLAAERAQRVERLERSEQGATGHGEHGKSDRGASDRGKADSSVADGSKGDHGASARGASERRTHAGAGLMEQDSPADATCKPGAADLAASVKAAAEGDAAHDGTAAGDVAAMEVEGGLSAGLDGASLHAAGSAAASGDPMPRSGTDAQMPVVSGEQPGPVPMDVVEEIAVKQHSDAPVTPGDAATARAACALPSLGAAVGAAHGSQQSGLPGSEVSALEGLLSDAQGRSDRGSPLEEPADHLPSGAADEPLPSAPAAALPADLANAAALAHVPAMPSPLAAVVAAVLLPGTAGVAPSTGAADGEPPAASPAALPAAARDEAAPAAPAPEGGAGDAAA